jgi:hypothetical protein
MQANSSYHTGGNLAGMQGFEPRLMDPESMVLPLDDIPIDATIYRTKYENAIWKFDYEDMPIFLFQSGIAR